MIFVDVLEVQIYVYIIALIILLFVKKRLDTKTLPLVIFIIFIILLAFLMSVSGLVITADEGFKLTPIILITIPVALTLDIVTLVLYIKELRKRKRVNNG